MWAIRTDRRGRGSKKFRLLIGCIQMNTDQELMALQTRYSDLLRNVIRRSKTVVHGKVILCGSHSHFNPKPAPPTSGGNLSLKLRKNVCQHRRPRILSLRLEFLDIRAENFRPTANLRVVCRSRLSDMSPLSLLFQRRSPYAFPFAIYSKTFCRF